MKTLEQYLDDQLAGGRLYFTKNEAMSALGITADAFKSASARLMKKNRLISPWRGFYLILRPEDRSSGAPDPVMWMVLTSAWVHSMAPTDASPRTMRSQLREMSGASAASRNSIR